MKEKKIYCPKCHSLGLIKDVRTILEKANIAGDRLRCPLCLMPYDKYELMARDKLCHDIPGLSF